MRCCRINIVLQQMDLVGGNFRLKPANEPGYDLFGQLEFYLSRKTKSSGKTIYFAVTLAELSLHIENGRSIRTSWFRDQSADQTIEVEIVETENRETSTERASSGDFGFDASKLAPSASNKSQHNKTDSATRETKRSYSLQLATVMATGNNTLPSWSIVPPPHLSHVLGFIPSDSSRLTRIVPTSGSRPTTVQPKVYIEHGRAQVASSKGAAADENKLIHSNALLRKIFRPIRYSTIALEKLSVQTNAPPKKKRPR